MAKIFQISFLKLLMLFVCTNAIAQDDILVARDGSGKFQNIQDAINSLPDSATFQRVIYIKKGIYREKLFITKSHITLKGEDPENTIITFSLAREEWRCNNPDDYGTATINLKGNDITLLNLSFINSYGLDNKGDRTIICPADSSNAKVIHPTGHQMALRSFNTTRLIVRHCIFRAYGGDTVSPWNTEDGMFYFNDCTMEGGVDFYCPRGWALAENCLFICHNPNAAIWHDGSKYPQSKTVLINCRFKGDDGFKLGRYHRDAQFYLLNCSFPNNMADADIYLVSGTNKIQWGRRVYYYNCHREGGDYSWHKDNLPAGLGINDINSAWVYDYKWDPKKHQSGAKAGDLDKYLEENTNKTTDPVADNMLLYQRFNGGWPKHFLDENVNYKKTLNIAEKNELAAGYKEGIDATIDNEATTREIKYLVKAYKKYKKIIYLTAATKGVDYLLKAQYTNGGWPQFYPDFSSYRSEITYNDDAMINVLNVLYDIISGENDLDVIDRSYLSKCAAAVQKGITCILRTQLKQKNKLTVWCAQYDAKTLLPAMARKYELPSLSGEESVGIVRFLMRLDNPNPEVINSVKNAIAWFNQVKIPGYNFINIKSPKEISGRDRILVKDPNSVIWARFYDLKTNEPFFSGRDSQRKKSLAEIENERRIGYAWYGTWPSALLANEYPAWVSKWKIQNNLKMITTEPK